MKNIKLLVLLFSIITISCGNNDNSLLTEYPSEIIGSWINPIYTDSTIVLERSNELIDTTYGITFLNNHTIKEHKNNGWCGTPPISYGLYDGIWAQEDDQLTLKTQYWGGSARVVWQIIEISQTRMTIKEVKFERLD